jgi:hypothetical protein
MFENTTRFFLATLLGPKHRVQRLKRFADPQNITILNARFRRQPINSQTNGLPYTLSYMRPLARVVFSVARHASTH